MDNPTASSPIQRRPVRQAPQVRLLRLAAEARLPAQPGQPAVVDDGSPVTYLTGGPYPQEAKELLLWRRTWDPEYNKSISVSLSKAKDPSFDYREVNRALTAALTDNGSPGLVEALLDISRDTKDRLRDMIKAKEQKIKWVELMTGAVWKRRYDLVRLLASRADQASLDAVLREAMRNQDAQAVRILLERGADPAEYHAEFMAIANGPNTELQELLICAPRPPCHRCRSEALIIAAQAGSVQLTSLLAQKGVDADWRDWAAIRAAVKNGQRDVVLAIVLGPSPPQPASLDGALGLLYGPSGSDIEQTLKFAEILLCAGARGDHTSNVLISAVKNRQMALLDLLMTHGGSVDFRRGEAIRCAIASKDRQFLPRLLLGKPGAPTLSAVLQATEEGLLEDLQYAKEVLGKLLSAGLEGEAVEQLFHKLVLLACKTGPQGEQAVQYLDSIDLIRMLADGKFASINAKDAAALRTAAGSACIDVLRILLEKQPSESSLRAAFAEGTTIAVDNPNRIHVLTALIDAGVRGPVVDHALAAAVMRGRQGMQEIKLMLRVASVDYDHGAALKAALVQRDREYLDILLSHSPSTPTIQHVWDAAAKLDDHQQQYQVYQRLLEFDPSIAPLNRELVAATSKGPLAHDLCALLLEKGASVEANEGLAMAAAVNARNVAVLNLLLTRRPPASTLNNAAQSAWLLPIETRLEFAQILLDYGLEQPALDRGLLVSATEHAPCIPLLDNLLKHDASPDFNHGEVIMRVAQGGNLDLLLVLLPRVSSSESLTNALGNLLQQPSWYAAPALPLLGALLTHGARGPWIDSSFIRACVGFNTEAYLALIDYISSELVLTDALRAVLSRDTAWQSPAGLPVVEILLSRGASEAVIRPAFVQAASTFSTSALFVLQNYMKDPAALAMAWGEAVLTNDEWLAETSLPVLEVILALGAQVDLNFSLVQAVAASSSRRELVALVEMLLRYGADANCSGSQPLRLAVLRGNAALVRLFCLHQPSSETIWLAFFALIRGHAREDPELVLACLRHLIECPQSKLDLNSAPGSEDLPLIQILTRFPRSPALVRLAIQAGANVMSAAVCPVLLTDGDEWRSISGHKSGELDMPGLRLTEDIPALLWALMQPNTELDDAVVETLIELGADVNYQTTHLKYTPLILAAKHNRPAIIAKLLDYGAQRDVKDNFQNTALLYASRNGHLDCVKILLYRNESVNDGSLHEASRNLNSAIVELLVQAGHDPNLPSDLHGDRTPLGELCFLSNAVAPGAALDRTICALLSGGADPGGNPGSKTPPIFLAMANDHPKIMSEAVVERLPRGSLTRPDLVFERDQIAYSLTSYLKKLVLPSAGPIKRDQFAMSPSSNIPYPLESNFEAFEASTNSQAFHLAVATVYSELLHYFARNGATDRFYYTGTELVQPADMVGAPADIASRETTRRQEIGQLHTPRSVSGPAILHNSISQPHLRTARDDELYFRAGTPPLPSVASEVQWRMAEGSRQVQDRRTLSDLVDRHRSLHQELRKQAQKLSRKSSQKLQQDGAALASEWLASQFAEARRRGGHGLEFVEVESLRQEDGRIAEAMARSRHMKLSEHERFRDGSFPDAQERQLARRPTKEDLRTFHAGNTEVDTRGIDDERMPAAFAELRVG